MKVVVLWDGTVQFLEKAWRTKLVCDWCGGIGYFATTRDNVVCRRCEGKGTIQCIPWWLTIGRE